MHHNTLKLLKDLRWLLFYAIGQNLRVLGGEEKTTGAFALIVQGAAPSLANGRRYSFIGGADYPPKAGQRQI